MSTNHTPNYNLCQWEETDHVLRTDFNSDNEKIDAALKSLEDGKASTASHNSLQRLVQTIWGQVPRHTYDGYYGDGLYGTSHMTTLDFNGSIPGLPKLVIVVAADGTGDLLFILRGMDRARTTGGTTLNVVWGSGDATVSFYGSSAAAQFNEVGKHYLYYGIE